MRKFGALLSIGIPSKYDSDITYSLTIHSNVLRYQSQDMNANLELLPAPAIAVGNVDPSKLKGHNLSLQTMRSSLPSFLLQIYANPCLYWLHQPAFYVVILRLRITSEEDITTEMEQMKRLFASEFVTRNCNAGQDSKRIIEIMNSINISENDELADLLLASILPFVFCYFNVVEVIRDQVNICILTFISNYFTYVNLNPNLYLVFHVLHAADKKSIYRQTTICEGANAC